MNRRLLAWAGLIALGGLAAAPLAAQDQAASPGRGLGRKVDGARGRKAVRAGLPSELGARSGADAVAALEGDLAAKVRAQGGDPAQYAGALAADESLWVDAEGQLMFVDVLEHEVPGPGDGPGTPDPPPITTPPPTPSGHLPSGLPIHHSKPGAPWTFYLDFDGAVVRPSGIGWHFSGTRATTGLTIDGDALSFNADEQAVISRVWGRVAEDWMPFDVDITTEPPAVIDGRVLWSIVGNRPGDFGFSNGVAGVSLFNFGYMPFGPNTPTLTFWGAWGATDHSGIADTISQENGHMFGLLHDGVVTDTGFIVEYYGGHGTGPTSWAPIMGQGGRNVTQWSRGDYPGHVNPFCTGFGSCSPQPAQDDIAIIAGRVGLRADDHGDDLASATPLVSPGAGVITSTTDIDVFALPRVTDVNLAITPFRAGELTDGGNLDVAAEIVTAGGLVVASADDLHETAASLTAVLGPGQHYLRVRASFAPDDYPIYDSLGQYTITGTFTNTVRLTGVGEPLPAGAVNAGRTLPVKFTLTAAVANARAQLWSHDLEAAATVLADSDCKAQSGFRQHCNLKLPKTLTSGATYWIAMQYEDVDGHWVTATVASGAAATNPLPLLVR